MHFPISIVNESRWKFETFATGGLSAVVSVSGGMLMLNDPAKNTVTFGFAGLGAGLSFGVRLPKWIYTALKVPKMFKPKKTSTIGPADFDSTGMVYVTGNCPGDDLTADDLRGVCVFVEAGAGLIGGGSGMVMLAGLDGHPTMWKQMLSAVYPMARLFFFLSSARAVIPMAGFNIGPQAGGGIAGYVGRVW